MSQKKLKNQANPPPILDLSKPNVFRLISYPLPPPKSVLCHPLPYKGLELFYFNLIIHVENMCPRVSGRAWLSD